MNGLSKRASYFLVVCLVAELYPHGLFISVCLNHIYASPFLQSVAQCGPVPEEEVT